MAKKQIFTCWHAPDYSIIEVNEQFYLEILNETEITAEWQKIVDRVEYLVKILNK